MKEVDRSCKRRFGFLNCQRNSFGDDGSWFHQVRFIVDLTHSYGHHTHIRMTYRINSPISSVVSAITETVE